MLYIIAQSESVELQSQLVSAQTPLKENHVEDRGIKGGGGKKGGIHKIQRRLQLVAWASNITNNNRKGICAG